MIFVQFVGGKGENLSSPEICIPNFFPGFFFPEVRRCPNPGQPENGRRFGNNFTVDAVVIFYCNSGFRRFGSQKRICQVDGSWSGNLTTCDDGSE